MELISREDAYTELYHELESEIIPEEDDEYYPLHFGRREGIGKAMDLIKDLPTIDAVQVIRCKDCKYFSPDEKREKWGKCKIWKAQVLKDGYCSQGEKNEKN